MDINVADEPAYMYTDTWYFLGQRSLDFGCTATKRFHVQCVVCVKRLQQFMDEALFYLIAWIFSYNVMVIMVPAQFPVYFVSQFTREEFV
jgi:hypothetical protein